MQFKNYRHTFQLKYYSGCHPSPCMILILLKVVCEGCALKHLTVFVTFWSLSAYEASPKLQQVSGITFPSKKSPSVWQSRISNGANRQTDRQMPASLRPRRGGSRVRAHRKSAENAAEWPLTRQSRNSHSPVRSVGKSISYGTIPSPNGRIQDPGDICSSQNQNSIVVHTNPCINIGNILDNLSF